jgi:hypothetical protein
MLSPLIAHVVPKSRSPTKHLYLPRHVNFQASDLKGFQKSTFDLIQRKFETSKSQCTIIMAFRREVLQKAFELNAAGAILIELQETFLFSISFCSTMMCHDNLI